MSWADDTATPYAGKETVLARRERPQILLAGSAGEGSSYGTPYLLFTSAEVRFMARFTLSFIVSP
jgi:hypothetical protein